MKGVVFTELFDFVEEVHGIELLDRVISECELTNGGGYTVVGTYACSELMQIVGRLCEELGAEASVVVNLFGRRLFGQFAKRYSHVLPDYKNSFELLVAVEEIIHVEVKKLYPDAELPTFRYTRPNSNTLVMHYESNRPFADLCEGLIQACVEHFEEDISIERIDTSDNNTSADFRLVKRDA